MIMNNTHVIILLPCAFPQVMHEPKETLTVRPESGCYIYGLFVEGARWSTSDHMLAESRAKELYTEMPVMQLIPAANRKEPDTGVYVCPMYKTLTRAGKDYFNQLIV